MARAGEGTDGHLRMDMVAGEVKHAEVLTLPNGSSKGCG